jgi:hypothetical protein
LWSQRQLRFWQAASLTVKGTARWLAVVWVLQQVPSLARLLAVVQALRLLALRLVLPVVPLSVRRQLRRTALHMTVMATPSASFAHKASLDNLTLVRFC